MWQLQRIEFMRTGSVHYIDQILTICDTAKISFCILKTSKIIQVLPNFSLILTSPSSKLLLDIQIRFVIQTVCIGIL